MVKMKKFMYFGIFFFLIFLSYYSSAGECEYGILKAWVKTLDENGRWSEWENATVHKTLKIHEPFKIKAKIKTKIEVPWLHLWLEEAGGTKVYEVVEGESGIGIYEDVISVNNVPQGWNNTYEWTVRPTGNWTDGVAPLNIKAQFSTMKDDKFVEFTVIVAYIESEEWKENKERNITADFIILIIISLLINAGFICRQKRKI